MHLPAMRGPICVRSVGATCGHAAASDGCSGRARTGLLTEETGTGSRQRGVTMKEMAMYLDPYSNLIFIAQQHRLQEPSVQPRESTAGDERRAARRIVAAAWQALAAVLRWIGDLPWDSREQLQSKEQELAMLGTTWTSDPVYDATLAREIGVARQRRREVDALAQDGVAVIHEDLSLRTGRGHRLSSTARREPDLASLAMRD